MLLKMIVPVTSHSLVDGHPAFTDCLLAICLLVAHNSYTFDSVVTVHQMQDAGFAEGLTAKVQGFTDTMPL